MLYKCYFYIILCSLCKKKSSFHIDANECTISTSCYTNDIVQFSVHVVDISSQNVLFYRCFYFCLFMDAESGDSRSVVSEIDVSLFFDNVRSGRQFKLLQ